jgi:hypothetical protein
MDPLITNWFKDYSQNKQGVHIVRNCDLYADFVSHSNIHNFNHVSFGIHMKKLELTKTRDSRGTKWIIDFRNKDETQCKDKDGTT